MFKSLIQRLGVVVVVGLVAACGGGGGGDSCNPLLSSCTGSGGGGTTLVPTATISLADDSGSEIVADRKSTRLNSSHMRKSRMPSSA